MSQRDQGQHRSKGMWGVSCGCMLLVAGFLVMSAQVQAEPPERVSVLVHLDPDADRGPVRAFAGQQGGFVKYEYTIVLPNVMNLRDIPVAAVAGLESIPGVARVDEDQYHEYVLNLDESTPLIRGLQSQIADAGYSADGTGIRVCVCDTGIDSDHVMYSDRIDTAAGYDFYNNDSNPEDDHGHGSHVAGIAVGGTGLSVTHDAACAENKPFQGVAPKATLIGVKILNRFGGGNDSDIIAGIDHCADPNLPNGQADVINLSIGTGDYSGPCTHSWAVACNNAVDAGVVVVAASGNDCNTNSMSSPACGEKVIAVGATWKDNYPNCEDSTSTFSWSCCTDSNPAEDDVVCFSNQSDYLDVTAPGAVIWSASTASGGSSITTKSGTSMSCPHVVGLAALVLDVDPSLTPAEVRQYIRDGAIDLGPTGFDRGYGYGRVDVIDTLALLGGGYTSDAECDDGLYCNGAEWCDLATNTCQPGTPIDCNDGVGCTDDSCNETTDSCDYVPNDANCDDGVGCTDDTCDAVIDCQFAPNDANCNDGVGCTDDTCDAVNDCQFTPNDANCPDNGLFCDGTEYCDAVNDCDSTGDPCGAGEVCNETTDTCDPSVCDNDGVCESGEDCDNCPDDCISGTSGGVCGNGLCESGDGEDCKNCPEDCNGITTGAPSGRFCCGATEGCDDSRCTTDGWTCTTTPQGTSYCCGDLTCEGAEDSCNCAIDCGDPPATEAGLCDNGVDDDCDGLTDCDDSDCTNDPACACGETGTPCTSNADCCTSCDKKTGLCR